MINLLIGIGLACGAGYFMIAPINVLGFGICLGLSCLFIVNAEC